MDDSEVKDWAMLVRANDRPGVLARISLLCQRFVVNLDFVRFDAEPSRGASGILVFHCTPGVVDRLARKIGTLVDVIAVDVMSLAAIDGAEASALSSYLTANLRTPRDFDDLMEGLAQALPAYSKRLTERLRQFRVSEDLCGTSPSVTREAAYQIERLEAENMLLSRVAASRDSRPVGFG